MRISWAPNMIGWACAQPFPTLAMPLYKSKKTTMIQKLHNKLIKTE